MPDYITTTTLRIVELLSANPYFAKTIKPGNQLVKLAGIRWPNPPRRAPADFPYFEIDTLQNNVRNANAAQTFANTTGEGCDRIVVKEVVFRVEIAWDSLDQNKPNQLMAIFEGILLKNPTLGLTGIIVQESGRFSCRTTEEKNATTGNILRLVQRISFPVIFRLRQADLVAAAAYTGA